MTANRVYLDHAATTDVLPAAIDAMVQQMRTGGNPSSLHATGREARAAVEYARERIAQAIGCDAAEVIFTSGGTEADNLAVKGMYWKRHSADPARRRILVSSIEHHAVEETCEWLETHQGAVIEWIPVDAQGLVHPDTVRELIAKNPADVALVTVMWANNEVGTIQPIAEIAQLAAEYGIPMHSDAVQAFGAVPVNFRESQVTTLAISGHKIGGGSPHRHPLRRYDARPARRRSGTFSAFRHHRRPRHCRFCRGSRARHRELGGRDPTYRNPTQRTGTERPSTHPASTFERDRPTNRNIPRAETTPRKRPFHLRRRRRGHHTISSRYAGYCCLHRVCLQRGSHPPLPRTISYGHGRRHRPGRTTFHPGSHQYWRRPRPTTGGPTRCLHAGG